MRICGIVLAAMVLLMSASVAQAGLVTTPVVTNADSYIDDYGSTNGGQTTVNDWWDSWEYGHVYLHFNLSALNAGQAVTSATLKLTVVPTSTSGQTILAIVDKATDWDITNPTEGNITGANAPHFNPGANRYNFVGEGAGVGNSVRNLGSVAAGNISFDVTGLVQYVLGQNPGYSTYVNGTDRELTMMLRDNSIYDWSGGYYSKENTPNDSTDAPRLEVTQDVPQAAEPVAEPCTIALMLFGLPFTCRRRA